MLVFWVIAHRYDSNTQDVSNAVQLIAQAGPEQAHFDVEHCPSKGLRVLYRDLDMFGGTPVTV
ncbi:hypothetical protein ACH9D2_18780 [Kocuria sp. M4R2S49]|uniref:hypothetical protein n=1 Tax=Kocuria rhizosphaericola TaxID=3376284 RepID=UPI0037A5CEC3